MKKVVIIFLLVFSQTISGLGSITQTEKLAATCRNCTRYWGKTNNKRDKRRQRWSFGTRFAIYRNRKI